ncbi:hypothetical protein K32_49160 [Kaistia sp. 32K]|uniref:hypothetical protein n=1 Tax=Kaistia sp. 32K TaxID=2795690 RepID=UPI0019166BF4|nr:hypothetical protein [Kaistia sp. 32K]BCP56299.1 hypothetical protein K32_49160 [Kaistia sp. 32K]
MKPLACTFIALRSGGKRAITANFATLPHVPYGTQVQWPALISGFPRLKRMVNFEDGGLKPKEERRHAYVRISLRIHCIGRSTV